MPMLGSQNPVTRLRQHSGLALLLALLLILWLAGGASRADVIGQVLVRASAWAILIALLLFARFPRPVPAKPLALLIFAAVALPAIQLIPLPPSIWESLPGRGLLAEAARVSGQEQPWRSVSISPEATFNALSSLIVPLVVFLLVIRLTPRDHPRLANILLVLVIASSLFGLIQFAGLRIDNPFVNEIRGTVSGSFANRNHFALFLSIGCLLAPAWVFLDQKGVRWKGPVALAMLLLFGLLILATGSRMGIILGIVAVGLGLFSVHKQIRNELKRLPPKLSIGLIAVAICMTASAIILSIVLDRAVSVDRAISLEVKEDLRRQALPVVISMTQQYFPVGSGFGAFDPVYRMAEPSALLSRSYFNHAHNDLIEIVLDGGLLGALLLLCALVWWLLKSIAAWRSRDAVNAILPRLGSMIVLLVIIASLTDYPARTPMIMAMLVIAAFWLAQAPAIASDRPTRRQTRA
jgi:O-antigen ligase